MKEFNQYMEQFKENSLKEKKEIALEQLKIITGLTNAMCIELGCANEMIITKDVLEGQKNKESEEDFVEAVTINNVPKRIKVTNSSGSKEHIFKSIRETANFFKVDPKTVKHRLNTGEKLNHCKIEYC